jgi:hypothetical protein
LFPPKLIDRQILSSSHMALIPFIPLSRDLMRSASFVWGFLGWMQALIIFGMPVLLE